MLPLALARNAHVRDMYQNHPKLGAGAVVMCAYVGIRGNRIIVINSIVFRSLQALERPSPSGIVENVGVREIQE